MSEFEKLIRESDLIIAHAGVGTIFHALRSGKVPIVVPRRRHYGEIIDDHQVTLSRALSRTQRVIVVEDVALLLGAAREAMARQSAPGSSVREVAMIQLVADALRKT
jgi:UDP-N-acetylglucosamine transferase subunit ALG13